MDTLNYLIGANDKLKTRAELEPKFSTGETPEQTDFFGLIHNFLSNKEDGIFKTSENPLCIQAGTDKPEKTVLLFYDSAEEEPKWAINLDKGINFSKVDGDANLLISRRNSNNVLHFRIDGNKDSFISNKNNFVENGSSGNRNLILLGEQKIVFSIGSGSDQSDGEPAMSIDSDGDVNISNGRLNLANSPGPAKISLNNLFTHSNPVSLYASSFEIKTKKRVPDPGVPGVSKYIGNLVIERTIGLRIPWEGRGPLLFEEIGSQMDVMVIDGFGNMNVNGLVFLEQAGDIKAWRILESLENNRLLIGGAYDNKVYFYWKNEEGKRRWATIPGQEFTDPNLRPSD